MTKILNLARLDAKLKRMPDVATAKIKTEMGKVADNIIRMMKSLVTDRSGDLSKSIGWTWGKAPKGADIVASVEASLGGDLTITIFAGNKDAYYARWVEFGHLSVPAHPYFYVSWRANKKSAVRQVRKGVRNSVKLVAGS